MIPPPEIEVLCVGDVNGLVLYGVWISALAFLLLKALGFEKWVLGKTGQEIDIGVIYVIGLAIAMLTMIFLRYFTGV